MDIASLIAELVERVRHVEGVEAIALGGSRARGTHTSTSDVDIGIYYSTGHLLDLKALARVAQELDDTHRQDLMTPIGGWGPWINGGGWLTVAGVPVDFLYRDLARVNSIIADCHAGRVQVAYQPGHPHCFVSSIYMAEVATCQVLWDPRDELNGAKAGTVPYPRILGETLIRQFAWEIDFSLRNAHKSVEREDVAYASGCIFRCVACLLETLFAINGKYWLNEKGALAMANAFPIKPDDLRRRVESGVALLQANSAAIAESIRIFEELSAEMAKLASLS